MFQKRQDISNGIQVLSKCLDDVANLDKLAAELGSPALQRKQENAAAGGQLLCTCRCSAETDPNDVSPTKYDVVNPAMQHGHN